MLVYPSKRERERLLEAILIKVEKPRFMKFQRGLEKAKLSPFAHLLEDGPHTILYHSLNLSKIMGNERLRDFYEDLKNLPCFDYQYVRGRVMSLGEPDLVIGELLERQFLLVDGAAFNLKKRWQNYLKSPEKKVSTIFISAQGLDHPLCDYWWPARGKRGLISIDFLKEEIKNLRLMEGLDALPQIIISAWDNHSQNVIGGILRMIRLSFGAESRGKTKLVIGEDLISHPFIETIEAYDPEVLLFPGVTQASLDYESGGFEDKAGRLLALREHISCPVPVIILTDRNSESVIRFLGALKSVAHIDRFNLKIYAGGDESSSGGNRMAALYMDVFHEARKIGLNETNLGHRLWAFLNGSPIIAKCATYGGQVSLTPSGRSFSCPHFNAEAEDIRRPGENASSEKGAQFGRGDLVSTLPLFRDECQGCMALGLCGGGCAFKELIREKHNVSLDFHCAFLRELTTRFFDELLRLHRPGERSKQNSLQQVNR